MDMRRMTPDLYIQIVEFPVANSTDGTVPGTYIDVAPFERFAFQRIVGVSNDTTVSMQVVQATTAAGAGSKNVSGAAITTTSLGSGVNNKYALVELNQSALDINNGFRFVAVSHTATGGSATGSCIIFYGWRAREFPVTQPSTQWAETVYIDS